MILLAERRRDCKTAFNAYLNALRKLKLPYHAPKSVWFYGRNFFETKSKNLYVWSGLNFFKCVPWVQFVGYQVRYDGLVRVKAKSLQKQAGKLIETTDAVKGGLLRLSDPRLCPGDPCPIRVTRAQAVSSLNHKLLSQGVGRIKVTQPFSRPLPMCWSGGFKALQGKPLVKALLKQLDRQRERQLRRLRRADIAFMESSPANTRTGPRPPRFYGHPYSYFGQFEDSGGKALVKAPYQPSWFERTVMEPFYRFCLDCFHSKRPMISVPCLPLPP